MWVGGAERTNKSSSEPWFGWERYWAPRAGGNYAQKKSHHPPTVHSFLPGTWYMVSRRQGPPNFLWSRARVGHSPSQPPRQKRFRRTRVSRPRYFTCIVCDTWKLTAGYPDTIHRHLAAEARQQRQQQRAGGYTEQSEVPRLLSCFFCRSALLPYTIITGDHT